MGCDGQTLQSPDLTLPHPLMHLRPFVLQPLAEILPNWRHPIFRKTAKELLAEIHQ
jgi:2-amino-4-hydroxy-6-hydroxymethyldihydropteridine diphosphokinase